MAKRYRASTANVVDYWRLFVNRRAYTMQSTKAHEESGRYYYSARKTEKTAAGPP